MANNVNRQHKERLSKLDRLAVSITNGVGTMACCFFFCALALISLPSALKSGNLLIIVSWTAQTFLQLVLLPLIMVSQNIQNKHTELKAEEDFKINKKSENEVEKIIITQNTHSKTLIEILYRLNHLKL